MYKYVCYNVWCLMFRLISPCCPTSLPVPPPRPAGPLPWAGLGTSSRLPQRAAPAPHTFRGSRSATAQQPGPLPRRAGSRRPRRPHLRDGRSAPPAPGPQVFITAPLLSVPRGAHCLLSCCRVRPRRPPSALRVPFSVLPCLVVLNSLCLKSI